MNAETDKLSPQQSLDLISEMINQAKGNVRDNSFYFLLWGWAIALAHLAVFILANVKYQYPYIVWFVIVPLTWVITLARVYRQSKQARVVTHLDKIYSSLWIGYGIFAACISFAFGRYINYQIDAVLLMAGGICMLTTGFIIRFNPIMLGSLALFIGGCTCFFLDPITQNFVGAVTIALGYLMPGYLLRAKR